MKKAIQALLAVPISDEIGKSFGERSLLGTGAALLSARVVLRSFAGMLALGLLAGGLRYWQRGAPDASEEAKGGKKKGKKAERREATA